MKFMEVMLTHMSKNGRFVTIYRPKPGKKNKYTMTSFFKEFAKLMSDYNLTKKELIIYGDFNFQVNKVTDPEVINFMDILSSFNLTQYINEPTHDQGNTLDLLIKRNSSILLEHTVDSWISDHATILLRKPECLKKTVKYRKLRNIDIDKLKSDIKKVSDKALNIVNLVALLDHYNNELNRIIDNHAPMQENVISLRNPTPWKSEYIKQEKQKRRRLERKWRKTRLQIDYNAFKS